MEELINDRLQAIESAIIQSLNSESSVDLEEAGIPICLIPPQDYWVPIKEAYKFLGRGWKLNSIEKMIGDGDLEEGKHWRDERPLQSRCANKKLNVYAVNQWLSER